jgi:hypothetical protein
MELAYQIGAGTAKWCSAGLRSGWSGIPAPAGAGNFSLHHRVQIDSGAHPASYPMGTGALFLGVKRPGREADHLPPSSAEVKQCVKIYLHSSNTPSLRGAQFKQGQRYLYLYTYVSKVTIYHSFYKMNFKDKLCLRTGFNSNNKFLTCIQEVFGSNLILGTRYFSSYSWYSSVTLGKGEGSTLKYVTTASPHVISKSQCITISTSFHSTL